LKRSNVRLPALAVLISLTMTGLCSTCAAQQTLISPKHHPWGAFQPGAWQRVCEVTETLDENGLVKNTSTTEKKTSLASVDKEGVTLEVEFVHEVAGKQFSADPQVVKQGFHGEGLCPDLKAKEGQSGKVVIEGRAIPCKILRIECDTPSGKKVTEIHYSATVPPHILRRHSVTSDPESKETLRDTTVDVVSLNWSHQLPPNIAETVLVRAVSKHPKGTVVTWAVTSPKVPGGIVRQRSRELDKQRRLVRRSRLELIDYGTKSEREQVGLFHRKRPNRYRKSLSALRVPPL